MKSDLKEYNDDQLECIDNRMYIKSSKNYLQVSMLNITKMEM